MFECLKSGGVIFLIVIMMGIGSSATAASRGLWISISTFSPYYSPESVQIKTGTHISWKNSTATLHSITHDGCVTGERCAFDSGPLGPNGIFTIDDLPPASYPYHCSAHPIMRGVLEVLESDAPRET